MNRRAAIAIVPEPRNRGGRLLLSAIRTLAVFLLVSHFSAVSLKAAEPAKTAAPVKMAPERLKAIWLCKFIYGGDWSANSAQAGAPLLLGILGKDPLLESELRVQLKDLPGWILRSCRDIDDAKQCQVLFISTSEKARVPVILAALPETRLLTVSDLEGFARLGGMIGFTQQDQRLRFELNLPVYKRSKVSIHSSILTCSAMIPIN